MSFIIHPTGEELTGWAIRYYLKSVFTLLKGVRNPGVLVALLSRGRTERPFNVILKMGESFLVFGLMDVWVIKETLLDRQYEQASVPLQDDWTVVDIGAALGDYAVWAANQTSHGRVIAVEPYPPSTALLRRNLELNQITNVEVFEGAVAAAEGTTELMVVDKIVQNSTVNGKQTGETVRVKTIRLEGLLDQFSIQICDYLKMDCEGGEFDILFTTSDQVLKRINRICMEVHDGMTEHNRQDMIRFLDSRGYITRLMINPVHAELAYLYAEKRSLKENPS